MIVEAGEPLDTVRAWKPPVPGVREVLHARHVEHAYPIHTHDVWTVLLVDQAHLIRRFKRFLGVTPGRFPSGGDAR